MWFLSIRKLVGCHLHRIPGRRGPLQVEEGVSEVSSRDSADPVQGRGWQTANTTARVSSAEMRKLGVGGLQDGSPLERAL